MVQFRKILTATSFGCLVLASQIQAMDVDDSTSMTDAEALAPARRFLMDEVDSVRIIKELETQYQKSPEQAVAFLRSLYVGYQKSPQVDMLKSTYGSECGTIYHEAVQSGTADSLWVLTQVDENWKKNIERLDKSNKNILHIAAAGRGNNHALKWLCDELLSKETIKKMLLEQNISKETPLHVAVERGNIKIFKKIFEWAQQNNMLWDLVTKKNKYGETVLHRAAFEQHIEITEMLLQGVGQDHLIEFIEMEDNAGHTAMLYIWNAACHKVRMAYMKNHPNTDKLRSFFQCNSGYQQVSTYAE